MPPSPPFPEPNSSAISPPYYSISIISHGHTFGPLTPKPNILIDLRNLPNPPVQLRKKYLGLSPRLRKEFFGHPAAKQRLEESMQTVSEAMEGMERGRNERKLENFIVANNADRRREQVEEIDAVDGEVLLQRDAKPTMERSLEDDKEPHVQGLHTLMVGVQCEMGRHRSVAMAEELGRLLGGRARWHVEVLHRDLGSGTKGSRKGVGGGKSTKEKWGGKRAFMGDGGDGGSWKD